MIPGLLAFVLCALAGCGSSDESTQASKGLPDEITIGAATAKSGIYSPYDASLAAAELLIDETNAKGGIDGHKLTLVHADTRSDPQQAVVAAQQVVEKGADVVLLTCETLTAASQATVAQEHDLLNFSVCGNEPGFGPPTTGRLSFSANPSLMSEASAGASFLRQKGVKRPFLFRDTTVIYSKADCDGFEQAWEHLGQSIAGSVDFKNEDASVAAQVSELEDADADAVVMCSYPPGGASAIKQIQAAGIDLPILGPSGFDGTFWQKGIPDTESIYLTSNGSVYDPPDPASGKLLDKLTNRGVDTDISTNLLATYAAAELIRDAIRETDSVEGNTLADALEVKPHKTIVGQVTYTAEDHYPTRTWPVYVYRDGRQTLLTEVKPQFIPEYGG
jgi:branched-chain amino acid transport system substrate-binding protein